MRLILTLVIGIIIGIGAVYLLSTFTTAKHTTATQQPTSTENPSVSSGATNPASSPGVNNQQLNKLKQQYQQQGGLPITATVDTVYPGMGFILKDNAGSKIFVHWTQTEPTQGESVTIIGKPSPSSDAVKKFQNQPGYTQDLGNFLQSQQYYVEAISVNPAVSGTPTPSV